MGRRILIILLFCLTGFVYSQSHEVGVFLGGSNFVGDIGRTNYIYPNEFSGGLVYKYNLNPRIALRANYNYIPISGDDLDAENPFRKNRLPNPLNFENNLHEFAAGLEFNFYEYDISNYRTSFTPYILAQFAAVNYTAPSRRLNLTTLELKNKTTFSLPIGIGIKGRLDSKFAFALETGARYTFADDLDFTNEDLRPEVFEGNGNDWYFFTGISIVYTFGKPACYNGLTQ